MVAAAVHRGLTVVIPCLAPLHQMVAVEVVDILQALALGMEDQAALVAAVVLDLALEVVAQGIRRRQHRLRAAAAVMGLTQVQTQTMQAVAAGRTGRPSPSATGG